MKNYNPAANEKAIISGENYRFTLLTPRLIRIEYNDRGIFSDRETFLAVNRDFDVPEFSVENKNEVITITTDYIKLTYKQNNPFNQESLSVCYTNDNASVYAGRHLSHWKFGVTSARNLKGTATSLDNVNGSTEIETGIMSMGEVCILDDSKNSGYTDMYLFCYGNSDSSNYDYKTALADFYKLSGNVPMLPKYALGNWWCRYYPYTQDEYINLMQKFQDKDVPLSVAMIDMDWHYTKIDKKYENGWTGFSWNKELFPDHKSFLKELHERNLYIGLNTHPQGGVAAHEERYAAMASAMNIPPDSQKTIEFDIENPEFAENYFKILHHPIEDEGVDLGGRRIIKKIRELDPDPLQKLNQLHFEDNNRKNDRALILSRYSGPGSHRYPVGFSGDSISSWESLEFQPYFTATASNIGYVWWSHDIGGFQQGNKDDELITRWVQLGVFSPINRLHSMNLRYMSKEPWNYNKIAEETIEKFLRLRHKLSPYIYTMNYRASKLSEPLIQPLYYNYTGSEAYRNKTEYMFGSEMIVSPIVTPHDNVTSYGSAKVYLPNGIWYDFFSGRKYKGDREFTAFRTIDTAPVFVKAGGIVPMAVSESVNDISNPETMNIKVYAGANGSFELYEDDGISNRYTAGAYAVTKLELNWNERPCFKVFKPVGDLSVIPETRNYIIEIVGIENCDINLECNGKKISFEKEYKDTTMYITVYDVSEELMIEFESSNLAQNDTIKWLDELLLDCYAEYMLKEAIYNALSKNIPVTEKLIYIGEKIKDTKLRLALQEIITNP